MKRVKSRKMTSRGGFLFKLPLVLGLALILLAQLAAPVGAASRSYYFPRVLIEAEIHPDGSITVVEERTFHFDGSFRGAWEYIYLKNNASIRDVLVGEAGIPYRQEAPGRATSPASFTWRSIPATSTLTGALKAANEERTFTISYTVDNAVLVHEDVAELYYQFIGTNG